MAHERTKELITLALNGRLGGNTRLKGSFGIRSDLKDLCNEEHPSRPN